MQTSHTDFNSIKHNECIMHFTLVNSKERLRLCLRLVLKTNQTKLLGVTIMLSGLLLSVILNEAKLKRFKDLKLK